MISRIHYTSLAALCRRRMTALGLTLAFPAAVLVTAGDGCAYHRQPPDIILVTLDTTRADRIGCYGCSLASTPAIDDLAADANVFLNAITPVPLTLPAHASMLTGLSPVHHGVRDNAGFVLSDEMTTLAEMLQGQGYQTAAFVSAYILTSVHGLAQGFHTYDDAQGKERRASETTAQALHWLEEAGPEPIFLWVHYFDPHAPYEPVEPYASTTRGQPYDAEISAMDASLGDLLAGLRRRGRLDASHLIVIGDHGEGLGDHVERRHGIFLYRETVRVPFLWMPPRESSPRQVRALVSPMDIVPTLRELLNLSVDVAFDGRSLAPCLYGSLDSLREGVYLESLCAFYQYGWSPLRAWRTARWKYIDAPEHELYDLELDPGERTNLAAIRPQVVDQLRAKLESRAPDSVWLTSVPVPPTLSTQEASALRSLGYLGGATAEHVSQRAALPDPKHRIAKQVLLNEGQRALDAGNFEAAEQAYARARPMPPSDGQARLGTARALAGQGDPQAAVEYFAAAFEALDPDGPVLTEYGDALWAAGRPADALEAYRRAMACGQGRADLLHKEVRALLHLGRCDEAAERYRWAARQFEGIGRADAWNVYISAATTLDSLRYPRPAARPEDRERQRRALLSLGFKEEARALGLPSSARTSSGSPKQLGR